MKGEIFMLALHFPMYYTTANFGLMQNADWTHGLTDSPTTLTLVERGKDMALKSCQVEFKRSSSGAQVEFEVIKCFSETTNLTKQEQETLVASSIALVHDSGELRSGVL